MRSQNALDTYLTNYKTGHGGLHDLMSVFQQVHDRHGCEHVLYPGSYLHVTPSLVFPMVCYVDSLKDICKALGNADLLEYIRNHKTHREDAEIRCYQEDYNHFKAEPEGSFDLLISLSAGFISQTCKHFLKREGLLLVNDEHYDASRAYVDPDYRMIGAFEGMDQPPETSSQGLAAYFKTTKGDKLTLEMVEDNATRSPSKARFKAARRADAYLFRAQREKP